MRYTRSSHFNVNELKKFARDFIRNRLDSLKKDIEHCLMEPFAPFPAILYCFSTIDLLGALYAGQANPRHSVGGKKIVTSENSKLYMKDFMNYTQEQTDLIMSIFRHKMVHLAQPNPIKKHNSKITSWRYEHSNLSKHLSLDILSPPVELRVKQDWKIPIEQVFNISIFHLMEDIRDSVERHGGYLDKFETDQKLQNNFKNAVEEIYRF